MPKHRFERLKKEFKGHEAFADKRGFLSRTFGKKYDIDSHIKKITDLDPDPSGSHAGWLLNLHAKGKLQNNPDEIKSSLKKYMTAKGRGAKISTNIRDFNDIDHLHKSVDRALEVNEHPQVEKSRKLTHPGLTKIHDEPGLVVHRLHDHQGAKALGGSGTKWCIAGRVYAAEYFKDHESAWDDLPKNKHTLYGITTHDGNKYVLHPHSGEFVNAADQPVSSSDMLHAYPKLAWVRPFAVKGHYGPNGFHFQDRHHPHRFDVHNSHNLTKSDYDSPKIPLNDRAIHSLSYRVHGRDFVHNTMKKILNGPKTKSHSKPFIANAILSHRDVDLNPNGKDSELVDHVHSVMKEQGIPREQYMPAMSAQWGPERQKHARPGKPVTQKHGILD